MITKIAKKRSQSNSSARRLVNYLTNDKNIADRVLSCKTTNCYNDDPKVAVLEMELTQCQNYRSGNDKTYHLIISFDQSDQVSHQALEAIEAEVVKSLGYDNHQRMSILHGDTDNLHLHLVINKINPRSHNVHKPKYDFKILRTVCRKMEQEYGLSQEGLKVDTKRTLADFEVSNIEAKTGEQTLVSWAKEHCTPIIENARSWQDLHRQLAACSVEVKLRGNGLVLVNQGDGKAIKMSTISREISKTKMEMRLGTWEPYYNQKSEQKNDQNSDQKQFIGKPIDSIMTPLYESYKQDKKSALSQRKIDHDKLTESKTRMYNQARIEAKTYVENGINSRIIKFVLGRKTIDRLIKNEFKKRSQIIRESIREQRLNLKNRSFPGTFNDWLRAKAVSGNEDALYALRKNARRIVAKSNAISGNAAGKTIPFVAVDVEAVTNEGTILYKIDNRTVKDDGKNLILCEDASDKTIATTLKLARFRHGDNLVLSGTTSFKERVFAVLKSENLNLKLEDSARVRGRAM